MLWMCQTLITNLKSQTTDVHVYSTYSYWYFVFGITAFYLKKYKTLVTIRAFSLKRGNWNTMHV